MAAVRVRVLAGLLIIVCVLTMLHSLLAALLNWLFTFSGSRISGLEVVAGSLGMLATEASCAIGIVFAWTSLRTGERRGLGKAALYALFGVLCHAGVLLWIRDLPPNPGAFR